MRRCPPAARAADRTELIDWRTLARRRRRQLLDRRRRARIGRRTRPRRRVDVRDPPRRRRLRPLPGHRPTRPDRRRPPGRARRGQPPPRPVPRPRAARRDSRAPGRPPSPSTCPSAATPAGFETWAHPDLFAQRHDGRSAARRAVHGRPGLGLPAAAAGRRPSAAGSRCGARSSAAAGEHASLLRIDHVLGVHRLWWVPAGAGPRRRRTCATPATSCSPVIAAEAAISNTTVVGENLGTVPPGDLRPRSASGRCSACYAERLYIDQDRAASAVPARTFAGASHPRHAGRSPRCTTTAELGRALPAPARCRASVAGRRHGDPALLDALLRAARPSARRTSCSPTSTTCSGDDAAQRAGPVLPTIWRRRLARADLGRRCADSAGRAHLLGRRTPRP